ncbi:MAG: NAD(P)-binding oxidoreductase [Vicinamibacterales bacterium]
MPHRILLIGATGQLGRQILAQALEQRHMVTALARRPEVLTVDHPLLTRAAADVVTDPGGLTRLLPGHDVVISALGRGLQLRSGNLLARATPIIVDAMQRAGIGRLVFVSAFGVGNTAPDAPWLQRLMFRSMLRNIYADKAIAESVVMRSSLKWTIMAPTMLTNRAGVGRYRISSGTPPAGPWRLSRADAASAVLACLDDPTAIGQRLTVGP